ncbi:MAG TPA: Gfo/Idh/MocA family oxidoreductase [Bryobacteraceae bacterium]|nr:Gfo/Idh/MocA family oxidoreductase [Bryobacteraceae bacterium]
MSDPLKLAVAGLGRMGSVHALNVLEISQQTGLCQLAAVADVDEGRIRRFKIDANCDVPSFTSVAELAASGLCDATFVVTPTADHRDHATELIRAGQRVLVEKPLTGAVESDREFVAELDATYPHSLMLAFQRRFDVPLHYARQLVQDGAIGRVIKVYSSLEDSAPAPDGYQSDGILPDMSIHNVDEVLWLLGRMPVAALAVGSRVFSHKLTTCKEDFDDAVLYLWFEDDVTAQIQVSRNHVSGYRVESVIYGEQGQIQVGRFLQKSDEVLVQAFGGRFASEPIARRVFATEQDRHDRPEFESRFGAAYKAELLTFIECCRQGQPFPTTHRDGYRAQQVIAAGMSRMLTKADAAVLHSADAGA